MSQVAQVVLPIRAGGGSPWWCLAWAQGRLRVTTPDDRPLTSLAAAAARPPRLRFSPCRRRCAPRAPSDQSPAVPQSLLVRLSEIALPQAAQRAGPWPQAAIPRPLCSALARGALLSIRSIRCAALQLPDRPRETARGRKRCEKVAHSAQSVHAALSDNPEVSAALKVASLPSIRLLVARPFSIPPFHPIYTVSVCRRPHLLGTSSGPESTRTT